ncbi:MAG: Ig-like domain-containing protein [Firmicutes bacterium]|nr:Ig-like domain-containing protein [Bacillota bacterium]
MENKATKTTTRARLSKILFLVLLSTIVALVAFACTRGDISVESVSVSQTRVELEVGSTYRLTATVLPTDATNQGVAWSSSNTAIATIDNSGLITAVSAGTATITVTTADGGLRAHSSVVVTPVAGVNIPVTGVILATSVATLEIAGTYQLVATVAPATATNQAVTWASSDNAIATVGDTGLITAVSAGTATITVTTVAGGHTATFMVTVSPAITNIPVAGVTLNETAGSVTVGGEITLTATVAPANATNQKVTWSSSDDAIATVVNGVVAAMSAGTATITVTTVDGGHTATFAVTVNAATVPVAGVTLNEAAGSVTVGGEITLTATVAPANATNQNVTWSSSNEAVAIVVDGVVTAVEAGTATITVTTVDGGHTATFTVTVNANNVPTVIFITQYEFLPFGDTQIVAEVEPIGADQGLIFTLVDPVSGVDITTGGLVTIANNIEGVVTFVVRATSVADSSLYADRQFSALGWVMIANAAGFEALFLDSANAGGRYRLTANIDLSGFEITDSLFGGADFTGILDGNGHTISGINGGIVANVYYRGLFGTISQTGIVRNIGFVTTDAGFSLNSLGAFLARRNDGLIENIYIQGYLNIDANWTAGWVFYAGTGTIRNSWSALVARGDDAVQVTRNQQRHFAANPVAGSFSGLFADTTVTGATHWLQNGNPAPLGTTWMMTTAQMQSGFPFEDWDLNVWTFEAGSYPRLVAGGRTITPVTGVTLTGLTDEIDAGETVQLAVTITPNDATINDVIFSTSNAEVAVVSATGLVTGLSAGTATITVTTADGRHTDTFVVTVRGDSPTGIIVLNDSLVLNRGYNPINFAIAPAGALQEAVVSLVDSAGSPQVYTGITVDGDVIIVTADAEDAIQVFVRVAVAGHPTIYTIEIFVVNNPTVSGIEINGVEFEITEINSQTFVKISTEAQFRAWATSPNAEDFARNFVFTNDIILYGAFNTPIGQAATTSFTGTLDGNGFALRNLQGSSTAADFGLFREIGVGGILRNIGIVTGGNGLVATGTGSHNNALIARRNHGLVENVFAQGRISGGTANFGGWFLSNEATGRIINSYSLLRVYQQAAHRATRNIARTSNAAHILGTFVCADTTGATRVFGDNPSALDANILPIAQMQDPATFRAAEWDETVWYLADGMYPQLIANSFLGGATGTPDCPPYCDCPECDDYTGSTMNITFLNSDIYVSHGDAILVGGEGAVNFILSTLS